MRRLAFGSVFTVALCSIAYLLSPESSAQTTASCPTGFTEVGVQSPDPLDLNLDGLACASEPIVGGNGIAEQMFVDNGAPPCGCPPGFFPILIADPLPPDPPPAADRNDNGRVCAKQVGHEEMVKFVFIDDRRGGPMCEIL